jgi:glycosyltransferase involved in cell wall biosynthesis
MRAKGLARSPENVAVLPVPALLTMTLPFSIIIPTHDRPAALEKCLGSLARLNYPSEAFEVIVIDDGSALPIHPPLGPLGSQLQIRLLRQENSGPANARNSGAAVARGDWLVFLDDDCEPSPGWLEAFDAARPCADELLGGRTLNGLHGNPYSRWSQQLLDYLYEYFFKGLSPFRFFASNNIAVAAARFRGMGGFDPRFSLAAGEDRDFCYRWLQSGGRLTQTPRAIVTHRHVLSMASFLRQQFNYGRGGATYDWLRAQQGANRLRMQPVSFYTDMLGYPWGTESGWNALIGSVLLLFSQVANAVGFLYQASQQWMCYRDPVCGPDQGRR